MMNKLVHEVKSLTGNELARANAEHPLFVDEHQGESVIREELEEAEEDLELARNMFAIFHTQMRADNSQPMITTADRMKEYFIDAAAECIQAAAMCQKFRDSFREKE